MEWLVDFQQHLIQKQNGVEVSRTYSLDEGLYGLEYLFNYSYSSEKSGNLTHNTISTYQVTNNLLDLFYEINSNILEEIQNLPEVSYLFIDLYLEEEDGIVVIKSRSVFSGNEYQEVLDPGDCAPFDENESYYLGHGGGYANPDGFGWPKDGELHPEYGVRLPNDCTNECGTGEPETNSDFALEKIEDVVNQNLANFSCPPIYGGKYVEYHRPIIRDVECVNIGINVDRDECVDVHSLTGCSCITGDIMNCLYCSTVNTMNIPDGYNLVSSNTYVDVCICGKEHQSEYPVLLGVQYCYAKMSCGPVIVSSPSPIDVEIR